MDSGRKVFIKEGQTPEEAMKESGKFTEMEEKAEAKKPENKKPVHKEEKKTEEAEKTEKEKKVDDKIDEEIEKYRSKHPNADAEEIEREVSTKLDDYVYDELGVYSDQWSEYINNTTAEKVQALQKNEQSEKDITENQKYFEGKTDEEIREAKEKKYRDSGDFTEEEIKGILDDEDYMSGRIDRETYDKRKEDTEANNNAEKENNDFEKYDQATHDNYYRILEENGIYDDEDIATEERDQYLEQAREEAYNSVYGEHYGSDSDEEDDYIETTNKATGAKGEAVIYDNGKKVKVYEGNPDGSDDKEMTYEEFVKNYESKTPAKEETYEEAINRISKIEGFDEWKDEIKKLEKKGYSKDDIHNKLDDIEYSRHLSEEFDRRWGKDKEKKELTKSPEGWVGPQYGAFRKDNSEDNTSSLIQKTGNKYTRYDIDKNGKINELGTYDTLVEAKAETAGEKLKNKLSGQTRVEKNAKKAETVEKAEREYENAQEKMDWAREYYKNNDENLAFYADRVKEAREKLDEAKANKNHEKEDAKYVPKHNKEEAQKRTAKEKLEEKLSGSKKRK